MNSALVALVLSAGLACAQGNPEFPQTQGQSSYSGSGTDYGNAWRSNEPQTGAAAGAGSGAGMGAGGDAAAPAGADAPRRGKKGLKRGGSREDRQGPNDPAEAASGRDARDEARGRDDASGDREDGGRNGGGESRAAQLAAAKENFAAVVEGYVAKRSPKGYWSFGAKKGEKAARLVTPEVDEDSIHLSGMQRYTGRVKFQDAGGGKPRAVDVEVSFAGTNWKVVSAKPAAVSSRR